MNENVNERNNTEEKPIRDARGLFLPGNPGSPGRPKGKTLKEYVAEKFRLMTDEEKEEFLKENKIGGETQWKMGEGQPSSSIKVGGDEDNPQPILLNVSNDQCDNSNTETEKED